MCVHLTFTGVKYDMKGKLTFEQMKLDRDRITALDAYSRENIDGRVYEILTCNS